MMNVFAVLALLLFQRPSPPPSTTPHAPRNEISPAGQKHEIKVEYPSKNGDNKVTNVYLKVDEYEARAIQVQYSETSKMFSLLPANAERPYLLCQQKTPVLTHARGALFCHESRGELKGSAITVSWVLRPEAVFVGKHSLITWTLDSSGSRSTPSTIGSWTVTK